MPLSAGSLHVVRNWIGEAEPPTDTELHAMYDADGVGSPKAVVEGILRRRLHQLIHPDNPAQLSAASVVSFNASANIKALQDELARLALMPDDLGWDDENDTFQLGLIGVQQMRRAGYRR
jgi:hypothetical protein